MARFDKYEPGQFSWVDLMTPDVSASTEFYRSLFGWTRQATPDDEGGGYAMFHLGDVAVAGVWAKPDEVNRTGAPPVWNSYITVDTGRIAVVSDPQGAVFNVAYLKNPD